MKHYSYDELSDLDKRHVWHPFTQMSEWTDSKPLFIASGEGAYLVDVNGKKYLDATSSVWVNLHGHNNRYINEAIKTQLEKISHSTLLGLANIPSTVLAKKLVDITPDGLDKVFYSDNGSTAVEVALKMAFQYHRHKGNEKTLFMSLANAYHGDTLGSMGVGGIPVFHQTFKPLLFSSFQAESPYCYRCHLQKSYPDCAFSCLENVEEIMRHNHNRIAAFFIEPVVQGAAGMLMMPPGYLKEIQRLCVKYDIFLIADEVATGFGRTGSMFACEHEGITPDFLCLAKGLTGGYMPLAATLATQKVADAFLGRYDEFKTFFHGHSYTGNQLGCAAAIASLEIFENEDVLASNRKKADCLSECMASLQDLPHVGDVRQRGLIAAIELVMDKNTKDAFPVEWKASYRICNEAQEDGVIIRPLVNIIPVMPPYPVTEKEICHMIKVLHCCISRVCAGI